MNLVLKIVKEFYILIIIFLSLILTFFLFVNYDKNQKIESYKQNITQRYSDEYKANYQYLNLLAQNSFFGIINKPEIVNLVKDSYKKDKKTQAYYRKKLYDLLKLDYERLKSFSFLQLHFHYPDNTSFLRMHKPEKFGDDLTPIRKSVDLVNKTFKPVNGFEVGRVYEGFRFVFPLFDGDLNHVGSVETSVNIKYMENKFQKDFPLDMHFLIKKEIAKRKMFGGNFDSYEQSNENDKYVFKEFGEHFHFINEAFLNKKDKQFIEENMSLGNKFNIIKKDKDNYYLTVFLPVSNIEGDKTAAYMVLSIKSQYLAELYSEFYKRFIVVLVFLIWFAIFLHLRFKQIEKYKHNEMLLQEQSKMASIGEMIENISHQWRQPLSIISVSASGMKLNHEYGMLNDDDLKVNLENIINYTQYLSNTIEDFRNYFSEKLEKKEFIAKDLILNAISVFKSDFEKKDTKVLVYGGNITTVDYEAQLKHVIMVLLKNINEFEKKNIVININSYKQKDSLVIEIQDNCGGIPKKIMKKIFEPYFTTKHGSMGSGLGLYIAYEIISKTFKGTLSAENKYFDHQFKKEYGACFTIKIPLKN